MKIFKTIRFKITLSFLAIFTIILIIFNLIFYHYFSQSVNNDVDKAMSIAASTIEGAIHEGGLLQNTLNELNETYIPYVTINDELLEVINSSGKTVLTTEQLKSSEIHIPDEAVQNALSGKQIILNRLESASDYKGNKDGFKILLHPFIYNSQNYVIILAISLNKINSFFEKIKLLLYICALASLLFSIILGWFFSGKIYTPIEQLILKTHNIAPNNLEARLPVTKSDDVISKLAITLNSMLDRIENAFSIQKKFTSDASHELKTPLTILKGEMEVALTKNRTEAEYITVLKNSLDEVNRLQKIIDNLLLLSKLEKEEVDFKKEIVDINELLTEAVSKITPLAKNKNITIRLILDDSHLLQVMGNDELLLNTFLNLFDNAIKYSGINTQIECISLLNSYYVSISFKDQGQGIAPKELDRIFDRFYRSDNSRSRSKTEGYGLGLAIVKAVINKHEGTINVSSTQGEGSVFNVNIPLYKF